MRRLSFVRIAWAVPLLAAPASAEVQVALRDGRVDVAARSAPLSEVLDRLARQTHMEVTYDGAPPRQLVTATVQAATPAEAVVSVLEGLGVNYALQLDPTGQQVNKLLLIAPKSGGAPAARPAADGPTPRPPAAPDEDDPAVVEDDDQPAAPAPEMRERPDRFRPGRDRMERPGPFEPGAPVQPAVPGQVPGPGAAPAVVAPMPTPSYPVSPFAPVAPPPVQQAPAAPNPQPPPNPQPDED